jgi:Leucine-rich repeat (LRR) protein
MLKCTTGIGSLKVLRVLAAHGNQLQWLPDALTQLSSLQDLWIQASIPSPLDPATPLSIFWMMWSFFEISPLLEPML